jgi:hypothetical protein
MAMGLLLKEVTRQELYEQVWQTPISKLAQAWAVSTAGIVKACEEMTVPRPGSGHWSLVQRGWEVRPALPAADASTRMSTTIAAPQKRSKSGEEVPDTGRARAEAPVIEVPGDLRAAHLEVRRMKQRLVGGFTDASGLINSLRNHKVLRVKVSKSHVERALRITEAIVRALEGRGAKFVSVEGSDLREIRLLVK